MYSLFLLFEKFRSSKENVKTFFVKLSFCYIWMLTLSVAASNLYKEVILIENREKEYYTIA